MTALYFCTNIWSRFQWSRGTSSVWISPIPGLLCYNINHHVLLQHLCLVDLLLLQSFSSTVHIHVAYIRFFQNTENCFASLLRPYVDNRNNRETDCWLETYIFHNTIQCPKKPDTMTPGISYFLGLLQNFLCKSFLPACYRWSTYGWDDDVSLFHCFSVIFQSMLLFSVLKNIQPTPRRPRPRPFTNNPPMGDFRMNTWFYLTGC